MSCRYQHVDYELDIYFHCRATAVYDIGGFGSCFEHVAWMIDLNGPCEARAL